MLRKFSLLGRSRAGNLLSFWKSTSKGPIGGFVSEEEIIEGNFKFPRENLSKTERNELLNSLTGLKKGVHKYKETVAPFKENETALNNFLNKNQVKLRPDSQAVQKVSLKATATKKTLLQEKILEVSFDDLQRRDDSTKGRASVFAGKKLALKDNLNRKAKALEKVEVYEKKYDTINSMTESPAFKYIQNFTDKERDRIRHSNYVIQNYNLGEEGIDYMPLNPRAQAEFEKHSFLFKLQLEDIVRAYMGDKYSTTFEKKMKWKEQINNEIDELYDVEVKTYPGSRKGPEPQDDPKEFADWYLKNAPKYILEEIQNAKAIEESIDGVEQVQPTLEMDQTALLSDPNLNEDLLVGDQDDQIPLSNSDLIVRSNLDDWEISPYPDKVAPDWHTSADYFERWAIFRTFPYLAKFRSFLLQFLEDHENGKYEQTFKEKSRLYSLFRYYNTLPKFARDDPIVKNVLRHFEYTKHDISLKEKELMLNYAAMFTLPLNEYMTNTLKEAALSQYKYFVSTQEEIFLLKDYKDEEDDEDPRGLLGEAKHDKLELQRGQNQTDLNVVGEWQRPPVYDPLKSEEDPNPNLPLDFYDNEDGFWDDFIREKEEGWNNFPMIHRRPYFKH